MIINSSQNYRFPEFNERLHFLRKLFDSGILINPISCKMQIDYSWRNLKYIQKCTYRVLHTIQMKLILLCVWADQAVLGSAKTVLKQASTYTIQCMRQGISLKSKRNNP